MPEGKVIATVTREQQIRLAVESPVKRVNLLMGNIVTLGRLVEELRQADKRVFVHLEMVGGIAKDAHAVQYLAETFRVDGIISTKTHAIAAARSAGIQSILRIFAIDTSAMTTAIKVIESSQPDEVELMPGLMPRVIREVRERIKQPLIVGGLIRYEEEIEEALASGADYVSIGDPSFWK